MQNHFSYFPRMRSAILLVFVLVFFGCPPTDTPPEDEWLNSVHFDFLQSTNQLYFDVHITSEFQGGAFEQINVLWYGIHNDSIPDIIALNDDGEEGDVLPGDEHYSRKIANSDTVLSQAIPSSATGMVYLDINAIYGGNIVVVSDSFQLGNIRPELIEVSAPDTILRPSGATMELHLVTATVNDANGLNDIKLVGFTSFHVGPDTMLNNGEAIWLYDDGGEIELYPNSNITSGDVIDGDGIYSFNVPIFGVGNTDPNLQTKTGVFRWTFIVQDKSNEYGNEIIQEVVVQ